MPSYINCHTHTFNARHVPEYFLSFKVSNKPEASFLGRLFRAPVVGGLVLKILNMSANGKKYANFLRIGEMKTQDVIFEDIKSKYPAGTRIVVLPLNFEFMGAGKLNIPYTQQLSELIEVKRKYPEECLPFVFIDPRMGTATQNMEFVKSYIDQGFSGIKMYPSLGYYPFDSRLEQVYEYAQEKGIPILTHCSRGGIYYVGNDVPDEFQNPQSFNAPQGLPTPRFTYKKPMEDFKNNFIDPESYYEVLLKFPKLKLCFAHFGVDDDKPYPDSSTKPDDNWYEKIVNLMDEYENVYTDISYSLTQDKFMTGFVNDYNTKFSDKVKNKILYGTDYFMIEQEDHCAEDWLFNNVKTLLGQAAMDKLAYTNVEDFLIQN